MLNIVLVYYFCNEEANNKTAAQAEDIVDADTSVFIYLFSFLRYKLKCECVATQTRFLTSGGDNSSTRKLKHKMTYRQKATCLSSAMKLIIFS